MIKEKTKERVTELLKEGVERGIFAGASVLIRKDGEEQLFDVQGYANLENRTELKRDTIFRLYSMSKPVTAAAAMILMERGQLDLAQPVAEILPSFAKLQVEKNGEFIPAQNCMTVNHLLNMTSGLTYGDGESRSGKMIQEYLEECVGKMETEQAATTLEIAEKLSSIPLAFEPGSSWCYGLSADVLGAVIEKVSGMRFGAFLQENLFGPLGMKDTGFYVPQEKQHRLVCTYESVGDGTMIPFAKNHLVISNDMKVQPSFESGGAGLVSTIDDYSRFAQMLLNGGSLEVDGKEVRILSPRTVSLMTSGRLDPHQQDGMRFWTGLEGYSYSHLMRIMQEPERACYLTGEGEYGWDGWLGCYFANLPKEKMTILLMMQKKDAGTIPLTRKIRNVILAELDNA